VIKVVFPQDRRLLDGQDVLVDVAAGTAEMRHDREVRCRSRRHAHIFVAAWA
jgi:hypothetical protein